MFKTGGVKAVFNRLLNKPVPAKINLLKDLEFIVNTETIPFNQAEYDASMKTGNILLNWIIPDVGVGGGGHINIFRFISMIEDEHVHSRVYLDASRFYDNKELTEFVHLHYSDVIDTRIEFFYSTSFISFAHATIATAWHTAYFVKRFENTLEKFYFIQDYEPYFFPVGSFYEFAKNTYKFGFKGITAGDWLKDICINDFNMQAESFAFSFDKTLYISKEKKDSVNRVFFYARQNTSRRDFEIGILALELLSKKIPNFEVVFAGGSVDEYEFSFPYRSLEIMPINKLSDLYSQCDMCLILSNTNLSLLPLEVMASNSVAVCSVGENSTWLVNEENSILVDFDPLLIADKMAYYFQHKEELAIIREKGYKFAQKTSWEEEGKKVKNYILREIKNHDR
ncbi:glycosyltransferase family 1 protein [Clostridiaceae bacterium DONG20-135]|uniref:Glycosyltransferase family 1 protein n=2 Tax=Copranaerobaculum intestinale TaxID=2692629 RepID=A0A6N8U468_9FIRM|nr:glycosyltransferase family 1 protein [Copranaerobaculum intestinale]